MDICCPRGTSVSEDLSSLNSLSLDPPDIPSDNNRDLYDDLGNLLTEFLHIQNKQKSTCVVVPSTDDGQITISVKEVEYKDSHVIELDELSNEKCLTKCATFPCSAKSNCSADTFDVEEVRRADLTPEHSVENGHTQSANHPYLRSLSLPVSSTSVIQQCIWSAFSCRFLLMYNTFEINLLLLVR